MTCLSCEVTRAKLLAAVWMLGRPRHSATAWADVAIKLNEEFGVTAHYVTELDKEWWLIRLHPVTHVPIKLKRIV